MTQANTGIGNPGTGDDAPGDDIDLGGPNDLMTPLVDLDSYAPVQVEIILPGGVGVEDYIVPSHHRRTNLTVETGSNGAWTGAIDLFDPDNSIEAHFASIPARLHRVRFRFNWQRTGNLNPDQPFYEGRILTINPDYAAEGTTLKFDFVDAFADGAVPNAEAGYEPLGQLVDRQFGYRRFSVVEGQESDGGENPDDGGAVDPETGVPSDAITFKGRYEPSEQRVVFGRQFWSPSHIVAAIANALGWKYTVQPCARFGASMTGLEIAADKTVFDFIHQDLIPRATSASNEAFYFYTEVSQQTGERTLHFHAPSYLERGVVREYIYVRDKVGVVIDFQPQDDIYYAALKGAYDGTFVSVNAEDGLPAENKFTAEAGVQTADLTEAVDAIIDFASHAPLANPDAVAVNNIRSNYDNASGRDMNVQLLRERDQDSAYNAGRHHHARMRDINFPASMTVMGTHALRVFDLIAVQYYDARFVGTHRLSGIYTVHKIIHEVGATWTTQLELLRAGRPGVGSEDTLALLTDRDGNIPGDGTAFA